MIKLVEVRVMRIVNKFGIAKEQLGCRGKDLSKQGLVPFDHPKLLEMKIIIYKEVPTVFFRINALKLPREIEKKIAEGTEYHTSG